MTFESHVQAALQSVQDAMVAVLTAPSNAAGLGRVGRMVQLAQRLQQELSPRVGSYAQGDRDGEMVEGGFLPAIGEPMMVANPQWNHVTRPEVRTMLQVFGPMLNAQLDAQVKAQQAQELEALCKSRKALKSAKQGTEDLDKRITELRDKMQKPVAQPPPALQGTGRSVVSSEDF